jgi:hypothetical protein
MPKAENTKTDPVVLLLTKCDPSPFPAYMLLAIINKSPFSFFSIPGASGAVGSMDLVFNMPDAAVHHPPVFYAPL